MAGHAGAQEAPGGAREPAPRTGRGPAPQCCPGAPGRATQCRVYTGRAALVTHCRSPTWGLGGPRGHCGSHAPAPPPPPSWVVKRPGRLERPFPGPEPTGRGSLCCVRTSVRCESVNREGLCSTGPARGPSRLGLGVLLCAVLALTGPCVLGRADDTDHDGGHLQGPRAQGGQTADAE